MLLFLRLQVVSKAIIGSHRLYGMLAIDNSTEAS